MDVWTCNTFEGHCPVPTAAVIVAPSRRVACDLLNAELVRIGLKGEVTTREIDAVDTGARFVVILSDGDY